ncbi:MAG: MFS transporter [Gemmatimonadales bacterium]|nr:MFS transporter [Gemmatimonadales bacterium]
MTIRRPCLIALAAALTGCIQPLRLVRDDSPTVLSRQLIAAPNPAGRGTFRVRTLYYGSGRDKNRVEYRDSVTLKTKTVNGTKFAAAPSPAQGKIRKKYWGFGFDSLPVNGRVWYPEGDGPFPLILIVHGNHDMKDFSDPGYDYLGELLASRGFILASVDENFLNGNIRGENDGRGWMLLQHLKAWKGFNDSTGTPFYRKVDLDNIALMGHSRGGEAVAVAAAFNRLSHYPDDATVAFDFKFGIKGIVAIAPIDGQYEPGNRPTPLENINYLVIHGSHDGDVSSFSGLRQYSRIRFTDGKPWFKSAVWMYRANHGQWNTSWGSGDFGPNSPRSLDLRGLIPMSEQLKMAEVYLSAFVEATLRGKQEYLPLFRDHRVAGEWLPKTMYTTRFGESGYRALASYGEDVEVGSGTAPGVTIAAESLATWKEGIIPLRWQNTNSGHFGTWLGWNNRIAGTDTTKNGKPASYAVSLTDSLQQAWGVNQGTAVVFSLAPTAATPGPRAAPRDTTKKAAPDTGKKTPAPKPPPTPKKIPTALDSLPIELSVEAVDANGNTARVPLSRYGVARKPIEVTVLKRKGRDKTQFASMAELIPQTYVIPLADFRAAAPAFDPARLRTIRWVFDGTRAGTVVLTDVGLSNISPAFFESRRGQP